MKVSGEEASIIAELLAEVANVPRVFQEQAAKEKVSFMEE